MPVVLLSAPLVDLRFCHHLNLQSRSSDIYSERKKTKQNRIRAAVSSSRTWSLHHRHRPDVQIPEHDGLEVDKAPGTRQLELGSGQVKKWSRSFGLVASSCL